MPEFSEDGFYQPKAETTLTSMENYEFIDSEIKTLAIAEGLPSDDESINFVRQMLNASEADIKFAAYMKVMRLQGHIPS